MKCFCFAIALSFAAGIACPATVELNPASVSVMAGSSLSIALNVLGIGSPSATEVGSFDSFIAYDPALLAPIALTFGLLLGDPGSTALTATSFGPNFVEAAEVSLLFNSDLDSLQTSPDFTLATFSFQGLHTGVANFSYIGVPIDNTDGQLIAGMKTVPEPLSTDFAGTLGIPSLFLWLLTTGRAPDKTNTTI